jgi:predicted patatin/cPLA2 family phospholipase
MSSSAVPTAIVGSRRVNRRIELDKHPVVELIEARRESGSTTSRRSDGAVVGLAVEGGGMRGVVSAGMLIALDDLGFTPCIDKVFGSSAGGINAAFYLQGERWHALSLYYTALRSKKLIYASHMWRSKTIVDLQYIRDDLLREFPIDLDKVNASGAELHIAVTDVDDACLKVVSDFTSTEDLVDALLAGSWLPILSGAPFVFRQHRALDGGLLLDHPMRAAIDRGCTHVLVLSTQYPKKRDRLEPWRYVVREYLRTLNPALADQFWEHASSSMNFRHAMLEGNADPSRGPMALSVVPDQGWPQVSRFEQRFKPLVNAAREGYESLVETLTGKRPSTVVEVVPDQ